MTDREKLVELLDYIRYSQDFSCYDLYDMSDAAESIADFLISKGVTVQQWRDAKTDPPPQGEDVLLRFCNGTMVVGGLREDGGWYANTDAEWYTDCETFPEKWQPLPEPLKEGS